MAKNAGQRILEEAEKLVLKYGWRKLTVDQICKKTGVTRKTFYTYYRNKDEIIYLVLNTIMEREVEDTSRVLDNKDTNFAEKMRQLTLLNMKFVKSISMELAEDFILTDDQEIIAIKVKNETRIISLFIEKFETAKTNGEIREDANIDMIFAVARQLQPLYVQPEFQALFRSTSDMIEKVSNMMYYGIFKHEK